MASGDAVGVPRWIRGGHVYDVAENRYRRLEIEIRDGRIASLSERARPGTNEPQLDVQGAYVLPGFIDCHVHLCLPSEAPDPNDPWKGQGGTAIARYAAEAARRTLLGGITTVRDVGGWNYHELALRDAIAAGRQPGPRMLCAGRLLSVDTPTVRYYPGMYEVAEGGEAVAAAAVKQLDHGADLIKVMATGAMTSDESESAGDTQFSVDEMAAAVSIARDRGTHVAAHAHACAGIRNACLAGCHSVEHGSYGDAATYALLAERGTYMVPTSCVTSAMLGDPAIATALPRHIYDRYVDSQPQLLRNIALARQCGVTLAMGSDAGTPGNHHGDNAQEIVTMVEGAGLSAAEGIRAATVDAARLLGLENRIGAIDVGCDADLVGFAGDPLAPIRVVRDARLVVKSGTIVRNDLD